MEVKPTATYKMVKSEDLNHHGTLFAGRCSEWFVEASFICAAVTLDPHHIVCLKVHGLEFLHPSRLGAILAFKSQIVHAGTKSLTVYTSVYERQSPEMALLDGFVTFCYVDAEGKATAHGLVIELKTEQEKALNQQAVALLKR
ncbi:MAG: acyl-CoA thioesterase [Bacteroidales bacterium]|jgi:acyl-CoA hydrolase|nr:acyl-CoA thioesterase [Bacteroidales bacterium]